MFLIACRFGISSLVSYFHSCATKGVLSFYNISVWVSACLRALLDSSCVSFIFGLLSLDLWFFAYRLVVKAYLLWILVLRVGLAPQMESSATKLRTLRYASDKLIRGSCNAGGMVIFGGVYWHEWAIITSSEKLILHKSECPELL